MPDQGRTATDHVVEILNHAWLALLLSLGERLGLHDVMADGSWRRPGELAGLTGLDSRYLEEWLWGMAASGIVFASGAERREDTQFRLDPAYVAPLTSLGGPAHWSRITQQIAALARLEDHLAQRFRTGEGLPASMYEGRIADVLAAESAPIFARTLVYKGLPLTGAENALAAGAAAADLGCGTGEATLILARRFPAATLIGIDQSVSSIERARRRAADAGLRNVSFEVADLEDGHLDLPPQRLILAANTVHDLSNPEGFLRRVRDRLTDDGVLYLHELSAHRDMHRNLANPHAVGILTFSIYHCLPLAKRRPGIAPGGMWGRESYVQALNRSGFAHVEVHRIAGDPNNDAILAWRSGPPPSDRGRD